MAAALILAGSPAIAAEQAQQFDLQCSAGKETRHYRIDLSTGEFCDEDCKIMKKVAAITSGTILLEDQKSAGIGSNEIRNQVGRTDGSWSYYRNLPSISFTKLLSGTCSPSPFTGFPKALF